MNEFVEEFIKKFQEYLNSDESLKRRLKPFPTFSGGPTPYPGPGPYPPPNIAMDPTGWSKAKGYSTTRLLGREVLEISIEKCFTISVGIKSDYTFYIVSRKAENPCLRAEIPFDVFKDMALGRERVIYALADERNNITYEDGISLSDWITILGVIGKIQEFMEAEPSLWETLEKMSSCRVPNQ